MAKIESPRTLALQSRDAIELLSSKWRVTVLHLLTSRRLRANEIQRAMREVAPKVLTQTLRGLERDGLILREVRNVLPPHVEYGLTQMGAGVIPLLSNLCLWAEANAKNRDEARRRFDQAQKKNSGHFGKS